MQFECMALGWEIPINDEESVLMVLPDEIAEPLLFTNGMLAMEAEMQGKYPKNFLPPDFHAVHVRSQFRLVLNVTRDACAWLNAKTDHLSEAEACAFVREHIERAIANTAVGERETAFGTTVPVMSSIRVVAVTCYDARLGSVSHLIDGVQSATRRFVVHYNGF